MIRADVVFRTAARTPGMGDPCAKLQQTSLWPSPPPPLPLLVVFHARWRLYFGRLFLPALVPAAPGSRILLRSCSPHCVLSYFCGPRPDSSPGEINASSRPGLLHNNWFPYLFMRHPAPPPTTRLLVEILDSVLTEFYCFRIVVNRCTCLWQQGEGSWS